MIVLLYINFIAGTENFAGSPHGFKSAALFH